MQPLITTPAGTLIQMGSWNTHLVGEACTRGACLSEDNASFLGGSPSYTIESKEFCLVPQHEATSTQLFLGRFLSATTEVPLEKNRHPLQPNPW